MELTKERKLEVLQQMLDAKSEWPESDEFLVLKAAIAAITREPDYRKLGAEGGKARAESLSDEERTKIAKQGGYARQASRKEND